MVGADTKKCHTQILGYNKASGPSFTTNNFHFIFHINSVNVYIFVLPEHIYVPIYLKFHMFIQKYKLI